MPTPPFGYFQRGANVLNVIQDFGAYGDGVTDDWIALSTAYQTSAIYGIPVFHPTLNANGQTASYKIGRTLTASGITLLGDNRIPAIFPAVTMAALVNFSGRCLVQGLTFNGASLVRDVVRGMGMGRSRFDRCLFTGATGRGMRLAVSAAPATISAVTQAGPGPAIAISQPDPTLGQYSSGTMCLKIQGGGLLDAATYVFAPVNGIAGPFFGPFTLHGQTNIPFLNGNVIYSDSGIRASCSAGTFQANTTYTWTYGSGGVNPNDRVHFLDCEASSNGIVYASASLLSSYASLNVVSAPGLVSITSGTSRVSGAATAFLSTGATDGSMIYIPGAKFGRPAGRPGTTDMTMVVCALGDGDMEVTGTAGATVTSSVYAIGNGAGFWEDPGQAHANNSLYTHCEGHFNGGSGARLGGLTGPLLLQFGHERNSHAGRVHGTRSSD